jgi:hypothetical protein
MCQKRLGRDRKALRGDQARQAHPKHGEREVKAPTVNRAGRKEAERRLQLSSGKANQRRKRERRNHPRPGHDNLDADREGLEQSVACAVLSALDSCVPDTEVR